MDAMQWLEQLYETHHRAVFRFAVSLLRDPHGAEDVMQDTFLKAYQAHNRYRDKGAERAWLFQIARRTALDRLRRRGREAPEEDGALWRETASAPDGNTPQNLLLLLDGLGELDRQIVLLKVVGGLTHPEIAKVVGRTAAGVKKRYTRALNALRTQLKEESS